MNSKYKQVVNKKILRYALLKARHHSEGQWVAYCTQPEFLALVAAGAGPQTELTGNEKVFARYFGDREDRLLKERAGFFAREVERAQQDCESGYISQTHHYFYPSPSLLKLLQYKE